MHNNRHDSSSQAYIRRTASGAIDTAYYYRRALAERSYFLQVFFSSVVHCSWHVWGRIKRTMKRLSARQQLSILSTRELKDIGLTHSDIAAIASGAYATDQTRCARSRKRLGGNAHE